MENEKENKIRSLKLKGFNNDEVSKLLKIDKKEVDGVSISDDLTENSILLYSEMQKDLSKLVLKELAKENSDSNVILNSIKVQADLQDKKLMLTKFKDNKDGKSFTTDKINKNYIYERDIQMYNLSKTMPIEDVAKEFNVSVLSVKQSIDRYELLLGSSEELKTLSPTIISETIGLDQQIRLKILQDAFDKKLTRTDVRNMVNKIKNEIR